MKALKCLFVFVLCAFRINAQEFPMLHYTVDDGLPSNKVYHTYRDSKGFLWFGTDNGVARYNGVKFEKFTTADGLTDNEVFFFQEDHFGRIWLATYNGQLCYYDNDGFHNAANTPFLRANLGTTSHTYLIKIESDSSVTISYYRSPVFINIKDQRIKIINIKNNYNDSILTKSKLVEGDVCLSLYSFCNVRKASAGIYELTYNMSVFNIDSNNKIISARPIWSGRAIFYTFSQNQRYYYDSILLYNDNMKPVGEIQY